jgi:hypothetical protein
MSLISTTVSTTTTAIYTSSGNTAITWLSLCNYSAGNVTANVYAVPSPGSAGTTNIILSELEIQTKDTYQIYTGNEKLIMANGDSIHIDASANAAVTVVASYTSV